MDEAELRKLLHGPYKPPRLRRGDQATCLYRDCDVIVTGWTDARIPWPRCRRPGWSNGRGILVEEELARAIRCESSAALQYWWGVSIATVWAWRKALGVGQMNEGTYRLRVMVNQENAAEMRGTKLSPERVDQLRQRNLELGLRPPRYSYGKRWTPEEEALCGTMPDAELAQRTGRSRKSVCHRRHLLGLPAVGERTPWTPDQLAMLETMSDEEVAMRTGRSVAAVATRRKLLARG